jgi:hypothetical protein
MTIHFSNILTYHHFNEVDFQRKIYVDGFLLQLAIFFVKFKWVRKRSGLNFHESLNVNDYFYLLASDRSFTQNTFILPYWNRLEEITLNQEILSSIKQFKNVIIGISSPKQDLLAELLIKDSPDKNFFCLGAAVYTAPSISLSG